MSKKKKATAAGVTAVEAVDAVKSNPYVVKVATDTDLHDNVRVAYASARTAYDRLASAKSPGMTVLEDKKLHKEVANAVEALKTVGYSLSDAPAKKQRKGGLGRKLLVLVVGAGVAVAVSSDVRNKLLDLLFGAEEEFDYTSTTTPATPVPSPAPGTPTT